MEAKVGPDLYDVALCMSQIVVDEWYTYKANIFVKCVSNMYS